MDKGLYIFVHCRVSLESKLVSPESNYFYGICRILLGFSKMALVNIAVFVVLKILFNLISMQKFLFTNNCGDISKVLKMSQVTVLLF